MPAPAGRTYGPYRVVRPLGSGGMGTVLLAEDPRLGRLVALKTLSDRRPESLFAREQLQSEARAAAAINHPNVASVHDVLDVDGELVIVFEYVEGETLAHRLGCGHLSFAEALAVGVQLADGLAAAHAQGVIHRDLKPANVMLTRDGRAKILDFGLARSTPRDEASGNSITEAAVFAGTPGYAAPEQWVGEPIGVAADIFAFGVVLFEMFAGRRPFESQSRMQLLQQMLDERRLHLRTLNADIPASIDALVDTMLSREPARRPETAREVATVLRACERDHQMPTTRTPTVRTPRRTWWLAAAAALVLAIAALITTIREPDQPTIADTTPVVAVLPLINATGNAADDSLAAGVAESLTTSLASLRSITVLSRSAVMSAQSRNNAALAAKELGASYIVEGSVQRSGDLLKLSVSLVRPDQSIAWGDSVQGPFANLFELQSRLAGALGRALSVQISPDERAGLREQPTTSVDALAAYYRGRALLERRDIKGNVTAATAAFDEAVAQDPTFAIAHAARGEALWFRYLETSDRQDAQRAIDAGHTALRLDPDNANVRYSLAVSLAGTGRLAEAVDELERALLLRPNYDDARRQLGQVLAQQGKINEAIDEIRKAIAIRPAYWEHHFVLGTRQLEAARYRDAVESFKRVIELQPDAAVGHLQLGTTYYYLGENDLALASLERALALSPSAQALSNIGTIRYQRGEYERAAEAYRRALDLRPNSYATQRNLGDSLRRLGKAAEAREAYERAAALARQALQVNPTNHDATSALAVYLAKLGRSTEARETIALARTLAPENATVLFREGVVHALCGDGDAAMRALGAAVSRGYSRQVIAGEDDLVSLRKRRDFSALVTIVQP